jgi:hypothetical protein
MDMLQIELEAILKEFGMANEVFIIDNNISNASVGGHYLERAITLSDVLRDKNCHISLLSPSNRTIQRDEVARQKFNSFIFEPGFNTFHQKMMECITVYDRTLLDMAKEYYFNYGIQLWGGVSNKNSIILNRFTQEFLVNFNENIDSYYCAAPQVTISYVIELLKIAGFSVISEERSYDLEALNKIWFRVRKEQNAFVNIHNQRILEKYCKENDSLIFSTSNTFDLIAGLNYLHYAERPGRLNYILHQPTEFNENNSYALKMLISRLDSRKRKLLNFTVASNEFKNMLSCKEYNNIGADVGVTIGPFSATNDVLLLSNKLDIYPHVQSGFYLKKNKSKEWLIKSDNLKNKVALKFRIDFEKTNYLKLFSKNLDSIFNGNDISLSFLGDIRDEKLFSYYSQIVTNLWNRGIRVWAIHPTFFSSGLIKESEVSLNILLKHPYHAKYGLSYNNSLPRDIFHKILAKSSIIFNCYDRVEYACKQSGIFFETMLNGRRSLINPGTSAASAWSSFIFESCEKYFGEKLGETKRLIDDTKQSIQIPPQNEHVNYLVIDFNCNKSNVVAFFSYSIINPRNLEIVDHGSISCQANCNGVGVFKTPIGEGVILELFCNIQNSDFKWFADYSIYSNTYSNGEKVHEFYNFALAPLCNFYDETNKLTHFVVNKLSAVDNDLLHENPLLQNLREKFLRRSIDCALDFVA